MYKRSSPEDIAFRLCMDVEGQCFTSWRMMMTEDVVICTDHSRTLFVSDDAFVRTDVLDLDRFR